MFNWKQVAAGYAEREMEDRDARDAFAKQMSLNSRKYLMESGAEKLEALRKNRAEKMSKIQLAGNFGISKEAAVIMDASGDLDVALNHLSKLKPTEINRDNVKAISETVLSKYPEEVRSQILANSLLLGTDFPPEDLEMQLAMAAFDPDQKIEDIRKIYNLIPSDNSGIKIPSANVPLRSAVNVPPSDMNTVNKLIVNGLDRILGDFKSDINEWVWDDPDNGNRIVAELQNVYREAYSSPSYSGDPELALYKAIDNVRTQITDPRNQLKDVVVPPFTDGNTTSLPAPVVPPPLTPPPEDTNQVPGRDQRDRRRNRTEDELYEESLNN